LIKTESHSETSGAGPAGQAMRNHPGRTLALLLLAAMVAATAAESAQQGAAQSDPPLSPQRIRGLVEQVLSNQRLGDAAIDQFARTERDVRTDPRKGARSETLTRVVPTGTGNFHLLLERDGKPTDPADLQQAWQNLEKALAAAARPDDPQILQARKNYEKRRHEQQALVQEIGKAFRFRWVGRTREDNRTLIVLRFEPIRGYKSSLLYGKLFAHTRGTVWVDEATNNLVRLEAELSDNVSFGGGILAKVYRGGRFTVQEAEVAPGVWLPTHYTYDFDGRKLFLAANVHRRIDISDYRRVGSPQQALAVIRREHPGAATVRDP
jgi:hypothetical protein